MINIFQPSLGDAELAAVREVFESNWIGRGRRAEEFEAAFAGHIGVQRAHVTSVNSCTEGIFIALELAGIGPGDEVVLPTVSFVGAANAVAARGARPVFCDVDPHTLNPSVEHIAAVRSSRTKAVLILHYGGYPGDVAGIARWCRDGGILLIEDAAIAVASTVHGRACGTFGDLGVWSFDHGKIVVTVDGGMLYVRDPDLAARAPKVAYLGLEQRSGYDHAMRASTRWWDFEVSSFSRRSVTNDVLAAVGLVQLRRLPEFIERRRRVAAHYDRELSGLSGMRCPPPVPAGHTTSYYMYWVQFDGGIRDDIARDLYEQGIYTSFRYPPLHRVAAYGSDASLPGAQWAADSTLLLPMHQGLSDADVNRVVEVLRERVKYRSSGPPRPATPAGVEQAGVERVGVERVGVETGVLAVPGADIYHEVRGRGPTLLIVPTGNGDATPFGPLADELARWFRVVTYDRRGFSRSPLRGPVDRARRLAADVDDVGRLLDHFGAAPAHLFGGSSGAIVALSVLERRPELVRTVVAHEPPLASVLPDADGWLRRFAGLYEVYREHGAGQAGKMFREAMDMRTPTRPPAEVELPPERLAELLARLRRNQVFWFENELREYPAIRPDVRALRAVADRLVLACGADARDGFPYRPNLVLAELLGTGVTHFPGGHVGYVTHPFEFAGALAATLDHATVP